MRWISSRSPVAVLNLFDEPKSRGCKVKKGNWLRLLGIKKHRHEVESGGCGGDMGGEREGAGRRS